MWLPFETLCCVLADLNGTTQGYFGNFELHGGIKQLLGHASGFLRFMQINILEYGM